MSEHEHDMRDHDEAFRHLVAMSDQRGLFEHADGTAPRLEHGYCTDDNARLLVVASRVPDVGHAHMLSRLALHFVRGAQDTDGRCRNRMDAAGHWTDAATTEDCWGRSLWGFGVAAAHHSNPAIRRWALRSFDKGVRQRSEWVRAMAFAALGAAEVAAIDPQHGAARGLLSDTLDMVTTSPDARWAWPEPTLRYGNAAVAEAVIAAGDVLGRPQDLQRGLAMLSWLRVIETHDGHLSVTGANGRVPGEMGPQFDQQPIEVAAMADACFRAHAVTGDAEWIDGIAAAAAWFEGANDVGLVMHDTRSGGGYDGLHRDRVNLNQGAESTLAYVSTMQRADSFVTAP